MRAPFLLLTYCAVFFANWRLPSADAQAVGWRNDGTGEFANVSPPLTWSANENIAWKTELPGRSLASPIVVGEQVFIMAEPAELVCLSVADGKILWQRSHLYADAFDETKAAKIEADLKQAHELREQIDDLDRRRHEASKAGDEDKKKSLQAQIDPWREKVKELTVYPAPPGGDTGNTGSTPISDGTSVYAVFGTGIVSAHSLDGKRKWMKFIGGSRGDHSASPALVDGKLIVHLDQLHALDAATGEVLWKAEASARHGSPVVARVGEANLIITPNGAVVRASDGVILVKNLFGLGHSSPLVREETIYACEDGASKAFPLKELTEPRKELEPAWQTTASRTNRLASVVCHDDLLYSVTEQGILEVVDAKTGKRAYRERLEFDGGRADPSICLAGGRIYISSNRWTTVVIEPGREYKELARNKLGEKEDCSSSPAFAAERMFIRTRKHLVCVGK